MELRHLRYFLALAEMESLKVAAGRLGIGEASLARAIALLEEDLAQRLFVRQPHAMVLTRAGHVLQTFANRILAEAEALPGRVDSGVLGEFGQLRIGFTGSALFNPFVPAAIHAYGAAKPSLDLILSEGNSQCLHESVTQGRLDVAFVRPMQVPCSRLDHHFLMEEEMVLVLPPGHPLADRDGLAVGDLSGEPFVMFSRSLNPTLYDTIISTFVQADVTLRIAQHVPHMENLVSLTSAGVGSTVLPLSLARLQIGCTLRRDVEGLSLSIPLSLAVRGDDDRGVVADFLSFLKGRLRAHGAVREAGDAPSAPRSALTAHA